MNKYSRKRLENNRIINLNIYKAAILFLVIKETRKPSLKLLGTLVTKFFIPQHQRRLRIKKRQVVNVDHELDRLIPFSADYLKVYMSFSPLWIKSIYFIYHEFGKKSFPMIGAYIDSITRLYKNGFDVSDNCQSTTTRPYSGRNIKLKLIHWADPHLHCVPSLHVMVVCFNHLRIESIIKELTGGTKEYEKELDYLGKQAILITNSILYIKQHSINCIPAGLFALSAECSEFTDEYAQNLISGLSKINNDSIERFDEISSYIIELYTDFQKLSKSSSNKEILINFLLK
ncbi:MAG: hypothetical protein KAH95_17035, partial [Spirochaetales bacterium]|nr:hypothetical protein [Spirochaetales bacterium]